MRKWLVNILFSLIMVVMAAVLAVAAVFICLVRTLEPRYLTPIVERIASDFVDADVKIKSVDLTFEPAFPVIGLKIDSLQVVSHAFDSIDAKYRESLPEWSDSLISIDYFSGAVDIMKFLKDNQIYLHNVNLSGVGCNIVLDQKGIGNFDIYKAAQPDTTQRESVATIPSIYIDHFSFIDPKEIRYYNASDSTEDSILLLNDISVNDDGQPYYKINISGSVKSPIAKEVVNLDDISFGLGGRMSWHPQNPTLLTMEEFKIRGAFFEATADAAVNLDSTLTVTKAKFELAPVAVTDLLTLVPDSILRANRLVAPYFTTDAVIAVDGELMEPYCPDTDSLPQALAHVVIPECSVRYGSAKLHKLAADVSVVVPGGKLDDITLIVDKLMASGPATTLNIKGQVWSLTSVPEFDVCVKGDINLRKLPPIIANYAEGFISGKLKADIDARGNMAMLSANRFHELNVKGRIDGNELYYLSNDTSKMADINKLKAVFGTNFVNRKDSLLNGKPALAAGITVDTAAVLLGGVDLAIGNLWLGAGIENSKHIADTNIIVPLGGGIKLGSLDIISITDSAGAKIRDIEGKVSLNRYKEMKKVPEIIANLDLGRVSAGSRTTRFVLSKAHLNASLYKKPTTDKFKGMKKSLDSLHRAHPDLSPDSVYQLALEKRRHRPGQPRKEHVREVLTAQENENLEFELNNGFRKFLLGWQLQGNLSTRTARLFTPGFPLRNRVSRLDISFTNDSVAINNLKYKVGRSDLQATGLVSNIKKGLTGRAGNNLLKANFRIESDTIDVNQLAAAIFAGSAYLEKVRQGKDTIDLNGDESELDQRLDAMIDNKPDTVGPLLIPANIDAQLHLNAKNIMYSDLDLNGLRGDILLYDGGVNLNRLKANSEAGNLQFSALYMAPNARDMHFGFSLDLQRFNIERFLTLVPMVDSVMPIMRDFSGIINAQVAATVDIDSCMNLELPSLDAAVRLTGDSLAFINPKTYDTLGKWLLFKDRKDNKIKHINVEMIVKNNVLQTFPFSFDIDRYRLGVVGYNDLNLNFDYHIAVLKSPLPFKFGITLKGNPDKFKVHFGGAKFKEGQVAESVNVVDTARVNLLQQIEGVFRRGVSRSRFAKLNVQAPDVARELSAPDPGLSAADSLALIQEGLIEAPKIINNDSITERSNKKLRKTRK